ncbi:MAG: hypothetical protein Phyf2KO_02020 [Phycisphaerales bacterium]
MKQLGRTAIAAFTAGLTSEVVAQHEHAHQHATASTSGYDFLTNFGTYMPRTHCIVNESGQPDWPWIFALIGLTLGVIVAYARIYYFWMKTHHEQESRDRDKKMFELANIFFWCAVCGYAFSIIAFAWPAYRLLAVALLLLNVWSWKFILVGLDDFKRSLQSKAIERNYREQLERRNLELETLVEERTLKLRDAMNKADAANSAKSRFLATMSHEIRTPMTAIAGYAELLENDPEFTRDREALCRATRSINANSRHLLTLIDDILDLSKIEAGKMTLEKLTIRLRDLVDELRCLMQPKADDRGIALIIEYADDLPENIQTDPTRLRQILINTIGNAIKFTEKGSVRLAVDFDELKERVYFSVIDSGIGMTPEQLARVSQYESFQQADHSTTRRYGGTGLGLRISSSLARLLGGEFEIFSVPDAGTTVNFSIATGHIPTINRQIDTNTATLGSTSQNEFKALSSEDKPLKGKTVLIADDCAENVNLFSHVLHKAGSKVLTASDGDEAIQLAGSNQQTGSLDLILMDIQMPGKDGYETTLAIRSFDTQTPILAISADAMPEVKTKCLDVGCDDFLGKPISSTDLISHCVRWIRKPRTGRAA